VRTDLANLLSFRLFVCLGFLFGWFFWCLLVFPALELSSLGVNACLIRPSHLAPSALRPTGHALEICARAISAWGSEKRIGSWKAWPCASRCPRPWRGWLSLRIWKLLGSAWPQRMESVDLDLTSAAWTCDATHVVQFPWRPRKVVLGTKGDNLRKGCLAR
jgi:hypothetical protein